MDKIVENYQEAYRLANKKSIKLRVITTVRYYLPTNPRAYTAKQIQDFTDILIERASFIE